MKNSIKTLINIAILLLFSAAIIILTVNVTKSTIYKAFDNNDNVNAKKVMKQSRQEKSKDIDLEVKESFMEGCIEEATSQEAYCLCAYDSIINNIGEKGFITLAIDMATGEEMSDKAAEAFVDAVDECSDKIVW